MNGPKDDASRHLSASAVGDIPDEGRNAFDAARSIDEITAERSALRSRCDALQARLDESARRLYAFEQLLVAVREARIYRILRWCGRWRGVDETGGSLLRPSESTTTSSCETTLPLLVGLSHDIPDVVGRDRLITAAVRIKNSSASAVYLPAQHTSFWNTSVSGPQFAIAVDVDDRFLLWAQVPDDRIDPGATVTVFFPLHTGLDGPHRVRLSLTVTGTTAGAHVTRRLLDVSFLVSADRSGSLPRRIQRGLFRWRFGEWPRLLAVMRCWRARVWLGTASAPKPRRVQLQRLKEENRRLAFLEKQMRRLRVASRPCYLTVDTTVDCNLKCPLCYREDAQARTALPALSDMPEMVVRELIDTLLPTAYTISPSGWGEPLLSPHLDLLIDACARNGVFMSMTTNGVLLNRRGLLDTLVPVLHWLEVSIDSLKPDLFERLRAPARFDQVMRNVHRVGRIRSTLPQPAFNFGFSMTLFRENLEELPAMVQFVADCGGNFLKTDIGVIFDRANLHHSALGDPRAYNDACALAQQYATALGVRLFARSPFAPDERSEASRYGVCDYLYTHANISTDGSYKPCYSSILPSRADANGGGFLSLWNSREMRALRRDHDSPRASSSCRSCYMTLRGRDSVTNRTQRFIRVTAVNS